MVRKHHEVPFIDNGVDEFVVGQLERSEGKSLVLCLLDKNKDEKQKKEVLREVGGIEGKMILFLDGIPFVPSDD